MRIFIGIRRPGGDKRAPKLAEVAPQRNTVLAAKRGGEKPAASSPGDSDAGGQAPAVVGAPVIDAVSGSGVLHPGLPLQLVTT